MKHLQWPALILLTMGLAFWFWPFSQQVDVTLTVEADAPISGVRDIAIIVGNERMSWVQLARGDTIKASFHPLAEAKPQLTMSYRLTALPQSPPSDHQRHWVGPDVPPGKSYAIQLRLNASGEVVSRVDF